MPHMDSLETTRRIRQESRVPIIILTALGETRTKSLAFDLGADDYLTKPFGVGELLGRVKAVLRRADWAELEANEERMVHGDIEVDVTRHKVTVRSEEINITPTEFNLLVYFMKNAGKALPAIAQSFNMSGGQSTEMKQNIYKSMWESYNKKSNPIR